MDSIDDLLFTKPENSLLREHPHALEKPGGSQIFRLSLGDYLSEAKILKSKPKSH